MKIRLSDKVDTSHKIKAIWELLIGLTIAIVPLIISFTPCELSARIILIVFGLSFSYLVYSQQSVYWNLYEAFIDDYHLHIKKNDIEHKIGIWNIESVRHRRVHFDFREKHIKIIFKEETAFGHLIYIRPIDLTEEMKLKTSTVLEIIELKIEKQKANKAE